MSAEPTEHQGDLLADWIHQPTRLPRSRRRNVSPRLNARIGQTAPVPGDEPARCAREHHPVSAGHRRGRET